jgi:hypothetical protein
MTDLFGATGTSYGGNPDAYAAPPGSGPAGMTCKDCKHAEGHGRSRTYWKCVLVRSTNGAATDIRLRTPACRFFEPEPDSVPRQGTVQP